MTKASPFVTTAHASSSFWYVAGTYNGLALLASTGGTNHIVAAPVHPPLGRRYGAGIRSGAVRPDVLTEPASWILRMTGRAIAQLRGQIGFLFRYGALPYERGMMGCALNGIGVRLFRKLFLDGCSGRGPLIGNLDEPDWVLKVARNRKLRIRERRLSHLLTYFVSGPFGTNASGATISVCGSNVTATSTGAFVRTGIAHGTNCANVTATRVGVLCSIAANGPNPLTGDFSTVAGSCVLNCPSGCVKVPGNPAFPTASQDFCLAKREMKFADTALQTQNTVDGSKTWRYVTGAAYASRAESARVANLTKAQAIAACQSLGTGCHMVNNDEWMAAARSVESVADNWSGGAVGSGGMFRGNNGFGSDSFGCDDAGTDHAADSSSLSSTRSSCADKRQLKLANGEIVRDMAGNVWEHVNDADRIILRGGDFGSDGPGSWVFAMTSDWWSWDSSRWVTFRWAFR